MKKIKKLYFLPLSLFLTPFILATQKISSTSKKNIHFVSYGLLSHSLQGNLHITLEGTTRELITKVVYFSIPFNTFLKNLQGTPLYDLFLENSKDFYSSSTLSEYHVCMLPLAAYHEKTYMPSSCTTSNISFVAVLKCLHLFKKSNKKQLAIKLGICDFDDEPGKDVEMKHSLILGPATIQIFMDSVSIPQYQNLYVFFGYPAPTQKNYVPTQQDYILVEGKSLEVKKRIVLWKKRALKTKMLFTIEPNKITLNNPKNKQTKSTYHQKSKQLLSTTSVLPCKKKQINKLLSCLHLNLENQPKKIDLSLCLTIKAAKEKIATEYNRTFLKQHEAKLNTSLICLYHKSNHTTYLNEVREEEKILGTILSDLPQTTFLYSFHDFVCIRLWSKFQKETLDACYKLSKGTLSKMPNDIILPAGLTLSEIRNQVANNYLKGIVNPSFIKLYVQVGKKDELTIVDYTCNQQIAKDVLKKHATTSPFLLIYSLYYYLQLFKYNS